MPRKHLLLCSPCCRLNAATGAHSHVGNKCQRARVLTPLDCMLMLVTETEWLSCSRWFLDWAFNECESCSLYTVLVQNSAHRAVRLHVRFWSWRRSRGGQLELSRTVAFWRAFSHELLLYYLSSEVGLLTALHGPRNWMMKISGWTWSVVCLLILSICEEFVEDYQH